MESADLGITNAGKPLILAIKHLSGTPKLVTMTVDGNTGLDYSLDTGTGVGKEMGVAKDSQGLQNRTYFAEFFIDILTEESEYGYSTS